MTVSEADYTRQLEYVTGARGVNYHVPDARRCIETLVILADRLKTLLVDGRQRDIEDVRNDIDLLLERLEYLRMTED